MKAERATKDMKASDGKKPSQEKPKDKPKETQQEQRQSPYEKRKYITK